MSDQQTFPLTINVSSDSVERHAQEPKCLCSTPTSLLPSGGSSGCASIGVRRGDDYLVVVPSAGAASARVPEPPQPPAPGVSFLPKLKKDTIMSIRVGIVGISGFGGGE